MTVVPRIDEQIFDHLDPGERVVALAATKARRGKERWIECKKQYSGSRPESMERLSKPRFALGADTLVAFKTAEGWHTIGKPIDEQDAYAMLTMEAGNRQYVFSGLCLLNMENDMPHVALSVSEVQFSPMSASDIAWYVRLGEWKGAAGAYRIQGAGSFFIEDIKGSFSGVMGLPIRELYGILRQSGYLSSEEIQG
jgi:MAF protein